MDNVVNVISRTQRIIVGPRPSITLSNPDQKIPVTIVNAGPIGPPGINGQPGTNAGKRWYGEGLPGTIIGASPNDEYLDILTGDLYYLG